MWELFGEKGEKKVEYIELIYDLIFVYLLGRSNELLFHMQGGFFTFQTYITFLYSTLVILQIWYFSTLYINRYGSNSAADYIGLFINMYLLYYLAEGIRVTDMSMYPQYNAAWALILLNLAVQYFRQLRHVDAAAPWTARHLKYRGRMLLIQAAIVLLSIPLFYATGMAFSWVSLVFGFIMAVFAERVDSLVPVNSEHLTERVMLFVVFTFGETIVSLGAYFSGALSVSSVYLSLMAFLIVAGMFLTYGLLYDRVIDRERDHLEMWYIMIHIGLIIALINITIALEFMREPEVDTVAKNAFLVISFLLFYLFLFLLGFYAKFGYRAGTKFFLVQVLMGLVFAALMAATYRNGYLSIAVTVIYVYSILIMVVRRYRRVNACLEEFFQGTEEEPKES